eukprot:gene3602-6194_t
MGVESAVVVIKEPNSEELIEVPVNEDGSIARSTLESQFPGATGLKFKNPSTGAFRAITVEDDKLLPPTDDGWGATVYEVVQGTDNSKRKADLDELPSKRAAVQADDMDDVADEDSEERYDPRKQERKPVSTTGNDRSSGASGEGARLCYKCGGNGHIAAMCPSVEGARDNPNEPSCHLCRGRGHFQMRCPNTVPRNVCWKCGMYGHIGRECSLGYADPYAGSSPGDPIMSPDPHARPFPSAIGAFDRACYVCGEHGHFAARCPRSTINGEKLCHVCRKPGHLARDCKLCRVCLEEGHRSYDCPHRGRMQPGGPPGATPPGITPPGPPGPPGPTPTHPPGPQMRGQPLPRRGPPAHSSYGGPGRPDGRGMPPPSSGSSRGSGGFGYSGVSGGSYPYGNSSYSYSQPMPQIYQT